MNCAKRQWLNRFGHNLNRLKWWLLAFMRIYRERQWNWHTNELETIIGMYEWANCEIYNDRTGPFVVLRTAGAFHQRRFFSLFLSFDIWLWLFRTLYWWLPKCHIKKSLVDVPLSINRMDDGWCWCCLAVAPITSYVYCYTSWKFKYLW